MNDDEPDIIDVTPEPDEPEAAETPDKEAKPKRRLPWRLIGWLVVILAAVAGGIYLTPYLPEGLPGAQKPAPVQLAPAEPDPALMARITELESKIEDLENRPAPAMTTTAEIDLGPYETRLQQAEQDAADLAGRLDSLTRRLASLESRPVASGGDSASESEVRSLANQMQSLYDRLLTQQERLDSLEQMQTQDVYQPVSVLALARLRQPVETGLPYGAALEGVQRLVEARGAPSASTARALTTLETFAETGVETVDELRQQFADTIPDILAAQALPTDADWMDRTWAAVRNAVTIRRTGEPEGSDVEAIIARAETALSKGDLEGAVMELDGLTDRPAQKARDWLEAANARLDALAAIEALEAALAEGGTAP